MPNYRRGGAHPKSKLTDQTVRDILRTYDRGGETYRSLAQTFNVSTSTINGVLNRKTWRHVKLEK